MRKILQEYPFHTFLLVFYLSFFLFAQNIDFVQFHMMKRTLIVGSIVAIFIFTLTYLFVKEKTKSGIISTLILLGLFNYGVLYDFFETMYYNGLWPFKNIHRYTLVIVLFYVMLVIWVISRKIVVGIKVNYFLNILVLILLCFNVSKVLFNSDSDVKQSVTNETESLKINTTNSPNIYYMVLDGYANNNVLKKFYDYDNSAFTDFLKRNGFLVADSSCANYFSTAPSLASTLNMDFNDIDTVSSNLEKIRENMVLSFLKSKNYKTYRLLSGYAVTNGIANIDSVITISAPNEFERSILKYSICRLDDLFGFIPYLRLKSQINKLEEIEKIISKQPKFVFIHIVAPHPPYVFDEYGNRAFSKKDGDNSWEPKKNYISQLKYFNKVTEKFISSILKADKRALFILQSDHGPWITSKNKEDIYEARSMILNAIKPFNKDSLIGYSVNSSSVNTFRIIFKNYFDSSIIILPNIAKGKEELINSTLFNRNISD